MAESTSRRNFSAAVVVVGDDRVGVMRSITPDVFDRGGNPVDHLRGNDRVEIFGAPVLFGGRLHAFVGGERGLVAADFTSRVDQHLDQRFKMCRGAVSIDQ